MSRMLCNLAMRVWKPMIKKSSQGVYDKISIPVVTMDTPRKGINMETATTIDTEVLSNIIPGVIGSGEFAQHGLFYHKLATILTSLLI